MRGIVESRHMLLVTNCPQCGDAVTVPALARENSQLRCPLCKAEFSLSEVMAKLPPALEVVEMAEVATATPVESGPGSGEMAAAPRSERPTYEFGDSPAAPALVIGIKATPRARPPAKNLTAEVIKIVFGGASAVPIVMLIFWWGFGKDPFSAGPAVANYAPCIVPEALRQGVLRVDPAAPEEEPQPASQIPKPTPIPASRSPQPIGSDAGPMKTNTLPPMPPEAVEVGVRNAPRYTQAELREALQLTNQALMAWQQGAMASDDAKSKLERAFYEALARLGERVTFADTTDVMSQGEMRAQLGALTEKIAGDAEVMKRIALGGASSWDASPPTPTGTGIALVGMVKTIEQRGKLFETRLALEGRPIELTIVSVVDPRAHYSVNSRLMVLGTIVAQPQTAMVGYEGMEPRVVFGGFPFVLQTPAAGRQL